CPVADPAPACDHPLARVGCGTGAAGRSGSDGRGVVQHADPVRHRRRPDEDEAGSRDRRGRRGRGAYRAEGDLHRRCLSGPHLPRDDHPRRSGIEPDGQQRDRIIQLDRQQCDRFDHRAGGVLCRRPDGRQPDVPAAPRHDRDRRYRHRGQARRAARSQCRVPVQARQRRRGRRARRDRGIAGAAWPAARQRRGSYRDADARRAADS
ncbi:hypothetical protein LTR94_030848, partial [Friedmanniomyces endolithicus]